MDETFVLVHAPVLGPQSWAPVAAELARRGHRVAVPSLTVPDRPPYAPPLIERARAQLPQRPGRIVLVVHSGAGVFAPYLATGVTIFADAGLPPEHGPGRVIEAAFLPFVAGLARDGVVPPWPQWWPEEDLAPLFPDDTTRKAVTGQARPLPLAFYEEALPPVPDSWASSPRGYLRFSEGYRGPARQAADLGWPVRELPGEHLHMLVDPAGVADAITALAAAAHSAPG